ncbi:MAG TPA: type III pantothenate kinase [Steroidobacteraceae bacterium]|nr:type III pantothenate kinase [Steroidobacteraceae bacterium]
MSVLLIDIGNTRIKWARFDGKRLGRQQAAVHSGWGGEDYARRVIGSGRRVERILVASVAGKRVDRSLVLAAKRAHVAVPEFVTSQRHAGGVTIGYLEPWRLGVDRYVATIGAYHLAKGRPACVVGVGTAMTIDLVDSKGQHRGGAIIPAPTLMVDTLLNNTDGIRRRAQGGEEGGDSLFGRSTRDALVQGSRYAAAALVDRAVGEARALLGGRAPIVMLTGGGAPCVQPLVQSACISVPDLVLQGLAVLCREPAPAGRRVRR